MGEFGLTRKLVQPCLFLPFVEFVFVGGLAVFSGLCVPALLYCTEFLGFQNFWSLLLCFSSSLTSMCLLSSRCMQVAVIQCPENIRFDRYEFVMIKRTI